MGVNTNLCNDVLDAIQIISASSVEKAGYDKTIQAQILSCEDATIGKYRCRYQDAIIYAYSGSSDITFTNGAYVYILVPGNDMSKEKTILGTTKKLGINYISQAEGDQAYNIIGNNCITSENKFYLDTLNKNYKYTIYKADQFNNQTITLDITGLENYIKQSSSLIVGAVFKTTIPLERQARGHYGITYVLRFLDNTSNKQVLRSYTVDEDNMIDNPYRLIYDTRQYQIFDIDGPNFIRVESIQIFNQDFPGANKDDTDIKLDSGDIEISKLELFGATRMTENEINGVAISFYTPRGTFFPSDAKQGSYVTITAQVRIKGKLASAAQNIPFYWGEEDVSISPKHDYYNKYLGRGWRCLNDRNVITQQSVEGAGDAVVEWVAANDTYILKLEDAIARNNKFKVAIVYDGSVVTKEINIQNLNQTTSPLITIESDGGNKFYYDIGHPNLICKINGMMPEDYTYYWAYENNKGVLEILSTTTQQNNNYHEKVNQLNELKEAIAAGTKFANAEKDNLLELETAVNAFNFIQRVEGNQIHDVQINNITQFGIFKCSVYDDHNKYLGTGSITLSNSLDGEDVYSLVINNGSTVFQYNENGVAPNSKSLDSPQQLQMLSFTVYNNLGQAIDSNLIVNDSKCKVRWEYPKIDTLLTENKGNGDPSGNDPTNSYWYYDNKVNLVYNIANKYDIKKQHNQIKLTVDYKGMNLVAETNFTFTKQGQPGTNGTQYLVKLVPRTLTDNPPLWPMITKAGSKYFLNYGLGSEQKEQEIGIGTDYQFFKAQLWRSGEPVWQGLQAGPAAQGGQITPTVVNWQILANRYNSSKMDASLFTVVHEGADGTFQFNGIKNVDILSSPYANIIKCSITWQGKTYYGTIPFTIAWTSDEKYRINLKDYTGWRYAIYTNDGVLPQYDSSHPFEFIMSQNIKITPPGVTPEIYSWEDISLLPGEHETIFETPIGIGKYKNTGNGTEEIDANLIQVLTSTSYQTDAKNKWNARPASKYDGLCVNAAIVQTCRNKNEEIIGRISVPIHFLLNKYGMSNINAWDGNSVQLDNEGGFVLAPQVGAGQKESDNSFTGVLMGQTRVPGKNTPQIGLLGYASGDRTFFLNSKNGSAIFGKNNGGRISIDPSQNKAMLYSNNFWDKYYTDGDNDGLPSSYSYRTTAYKPSGNCNGQGMLIDLSAPEIFFGSGNFYVTSNGHVHAGGGGDIGGWLIGDTTLKSSNQTITLDSSGKVYSNTHSSLTNYGNGFYLSSDGLSIGSKAKLTDTGVMYIGYGATANGGLRSGNFWTINGDSGRSYISYGGDTFFNSASPSGNTAAKVYLGTDGFSLGRRFSVNNNGYLTAYSGTIGGWTIGSNQISASNIHLYSNGRIQTNNYVAGQSGWQISSSGNAYFNNGTIGGWTIGKNQLKGGGITLYNDGSMEGPSWYISKTGEATFHNAKISGSITVNGSLSGKGMTMGGSGGRSSINPGAVGYSGSSGIGDTGTLGGGLYKAYKGQFDQLYATKAEIGQLDVLSKLKYRGKHAAWGAVVQNLMVTGQYKSVKIGKDSHSFLTGITVTLTRTYGIVTGESAPKVSATT